MWPLCLAPPKSFEIGIYIYMCCAVLSRFSRVRLFATLWTVASRLLCPWGSPGENTGVGCHALLQGSSWPWDRTRVSYISCTGRRGLDHWATWEACKVFQSLLVVGNKRCSKKIKLINRVVGKWTSLLVILSALSCCYRKHSFRAQVSSLSWNAPSPGKDEARRPCWACEPGEELRCLNSGGWWPPEKGIHLCQIWNK